MIKKQINTKYKIYKSKTVKKNLATCQQTGLMK